MRSSIPVPLSVFLSFISCHVQTGDGCDFETRWRYETRACSGWRMTSATDNKTGFQVSHTLRSNTSSVSEFNTSIGRTQKGRLTWLSHKWLDPLVTGINCSWNARVAIVWKNIGPTSWIHCQYWNNVYLSKEQLHLEIFIYHNYAEIVIVWTIIILSYYDHHRFIK